MQYNTILFELIDEKIGLLTINRPKSMNALTFETLREINECLDINEDKIQYLIITGAGPKSFIAGADIKEMNNMSPDLFQDFLIKGQALANRIEYGNFIGFACVNGYALGGGFELALACDFIFCSENAKFGFPETKLGIIPGFGGNIRIIAKAGIVKGRELVISATKIDANKALDYGLVYNIFTIDCLINETINFVKVLSSNSFKAMIEAKKLHNKIALSYSQQLYKLEQDTCADCFKSHDREEGMGAFTQRKG